MNRAPHVNQNKAKEYLALLKNKSTEDILKIRKNIVEASKAERMKTPVDNRKIQSYNVQLSLIGRILANRKSVNEQERFHAVEDATINDLNPKDLAQLLKEKSLDELKSLLASAEKIVEDFKSALSSARQTAEESKNNNDKLNALIAQVDTIKAEIATRSKQASDDAKNDLNKMNGKLLGIDTGYWVGGLVGGIIVGAIGSAVNRNVLSFGVIGVGVGSGLVWLGKNGKLPTVITKPS